MKINSLENLFRKQNRGISRAVIPGLLYKGEVMNVIADPINGRRFAAWLAYSASSKTWRFEKENAGIRVLHITNEPYQDILINRYENVASLGWRLFADRIDIAPYTGKMQHVIWDDQLSKIIPPQKYSLIVLDAFYCTLPNGTDRPEEDRGEVSLMNYLIAEIAEKLDSSIVMITLASKKHQPDVITKYCDSSIVLPFSSTPMGSNVYASILSSRQNFDEIGEQFRLCHEMEANV